MHTSVYRLGKFQQWECVLEKVSGSGGKLLGGGGGGGRGGGRGGERGGERGGGGRGGGAG